MAGDGRVEREESQEFLQNLDGEIKAPGPSRSMSLVVLDNFRDLVFSQGPGNMNFLNSDSDLSGTTRMGRRDWSRSNH